MTQNKAIILLFNSKSRIQNPKYLQPFLFNPKSKIQNPKSLQPHHKIPLSVRDDTKQGNHLTLQSKIQNSKSLQPHHKIPLSVRDDNGTTSSTLSSFLTTLLLIFFQFVPIRVIRWQTSSFFNPKSRIQNLFNLFRQSATP
jgi:hypothetical protein